MEIINIMFCGVGGQGILTSSRILALSAVHSGLDVKMSEVHGMAQRGGNVDTHVRIGKIVPSSLIPKGAAHYLVAFEKLEALRYMDYLRPDGALFVSPLEIPPLTQNLRKDAGYVKDIDEVLNGQGGRRSAHGQRDPAGGALASPAHEDGGLGVSHTDPFLQANPGRLSQGLSDGGGPCRRGCLVWTRY